MVVKWVHLKVICGTSMYDYGTLAYVEGMSSVEALRSRPHYRSRLSLLSDGWLMVCLG